MSKLHKAVGAVSKTVFSLHVNQLAHGNGNHPVDAIKELRKCQHAKELGEAETPVFDTWKNSLIDHMLAVSLLPAVKKPAEAKEHEEESKAFLEYQDKRSSMTRKAREAKTKLGQKIMVAAIKRHEKKNNPYGGTQQWSNKVKDTDNAAMMAYSESTKDAITNLPTHIQEQKAFARLLDTITEPAHVTEASNSHGEIEKYLEDCVKPKKG